MKKITGVLLVIFFCVLVVTLNWDRHPLIGEWVSQKGDAIGVMEDLNAPYTIVFTQDEIQTLNKQIKINYIFEENDENLIYIEAKDNKQRIKIRQLEDGYIRFYFPGIGLRKYKKN